MNYYAIFLVMGYLFAQAESSKILFIACTPAPSHQKPFQAIWRALASKGHEVHVLTTHPLKDSNLTTLFEYNISSIHEVLTHFSRKDAKYMLNRPDFLTVFLKDSFATKLWSHLYATALQHSETERLLKNNQHFDVVIVEWIFPTMAAFASYYNAPLIGVTSLSAPSVALDTLGNPSHPIIAPDMNLPLSRDMTLRERVMTGLYSVYVRIYYHLVVLPREDDNIKRYLSNKLPYLGNIERNISALLLNRNPVFHRCVPLTPASVELGGIKFPKIKEEIDVGLRQFLESSRSSAIYFSLGSTMKGVLLSSNIIQLFQNVFKRLPYNMIWKWENDTMEGKPDNVFISKWIPQITILEHPNIKLFITQGGLQSTEEAIAAHKPIIGIPFHSDQTTNVDTCVKYGMGKMLDLEELSEEKLESYILEIINNPSYAENAKKLDELIKDQPQDGLEKAIWWIEYVIRHKGAKHLRSAAVDLPWWQYLMLDIIGFVLIIFLLQIIIVYYLIKLFIRLIVKGTKKIIKPKTKKE